MIGIPHDVRRQLVRQLGRSIADSLRLADALDFPEVGVRLDEALVALACEEECREPDAVAARPTA